MDTPPKPSHLPEWASDELPLLTETIGEPSIPLLQAQLPPETVEPPLLREPPPLAHSPFASSLGIAPPSSSEQEPLARIERELHAAAQLIMQEVIDEYMLKIEAELHRRLEDHLARVLRAGRR